MAKGGWHRLREEDAVTIARRLPVRFDFAVEAELPCAGDLSLTRVAHQVRQDMWRALQGLRGFAPAVRVEQHGGHLLLRAGGEVAGPVSASHRAALEALMADPAKRARWITFAGRRGNG